MDLVGTNKGKHTSLQVEKKETEKNYRKYERYLGKNTCKVTVYKERGKNGTQMVLGLDPFMSIRQIEYSRPGLKPKTYHMDINMK